MPSHIDPRKAYGHKGERWGLAAEQTIAGRELLYYPDIEVRNQLKCAALELRIFTNSLPPPVHAALLSRICGDDGLMKVGAYSQNYLTLVKKYNKSPSPEGLLQITIAAEQAVIDCANLESQTFDDVIGAKAGPKYAMSRVRILALLGDLGALMTSTGATTGTEQVPAHRYALAACFYTHICGLPEYRKAMVTQKQIDDSAQAAKKAGGSDTVGPQKKAQRKNDPNIREARTGILNMGKSVDKALKIDERFRIVPSEWMVAHILDTRWTGGKEWEKGLTEPLAGHMSASPSEILHTWDMLSQRPLKECYVGKQGSMAARNDDALCARAAAASAFLIGTGFHSALECVDGTMTYLGQSLRTIIGQIDQQGDAGYVMYAGAATALMSELLSSFTNS